MNSPRKIITVRLSPRDVTDSPELLNIVADIFPDADFDIDLRDDSTELTETVESSTAEEAKENAKAALDLQDQAIRVGMAVVESPEKAEVETHQWLKTLREEGIRIFGDILVGYVVDRLTGKR